MSVLGAIWRGLRALLGIADTAADVVDLGSDIARAVSPPKRKPAPATPLRPFTPRPPPCPPSDPPVSSPRQILTPVPATKPGAGVKGPPRPRR